MILGRGVLGDDAAVLIGDAYIAGLKLGEGNDDCLRFDPSLLILLLQDVEEGFFAKPTASSSLSSS